MFPDGTLSDSIDKTRKLKTFLDPVDLSSAEIYQSNKLFAMLASWVQDCPAAAKLSRAIRQQNGFELWRLL